MVDVDAGAEVSLNGQAGGVYPRLTACNPGRRVRRAPPGLAPLAFALALGAAPGAFGQAIERNLPPPPTSGPSTILTPQAAPRSHDETQLAGPLTTLVVIGPAEPARTKTSAGLDLASAPRLNTPQARRRLSRFLGRPLSRALISSIEADITRTYRARGFPLVSVTTPEQELTHGVLQLRVIEFRLGKKTAPGAHDPGYVLSRIRVQPGQPVNTGRLAQDLDWLNRFPFRRISAAFTPGGRLGETDLVLQTTQSRPFSVYTGYSTSGSPLTGFDRYIAGASVAIPFLHDATASYQFTGSNDVLFSQDRPFNSAPEPRYLSHSGRITIPTLPRQEFEFVVSSVNSNEITDFVAHQTTVEYTFDYRAALSDFLSFLPGDGALGVETRHESGQTLFAGEPVQSGEIDVYQVFLSWAGAESDRFGRSAGDLTLHLSPGGVNGRNTDAQFAAASQGRSRTAEYGYVAGDFSRYTPLPARLGYSLQLIGQYSPNPLPLTEQSGAGGPSLVRGYTLDDGVFDSSLVARNELRTPSFPVIGRVFRKAPADALSPFAFVDAAYGKNDYTHGDESPIGAGFGADYQFGEHLNGGLTTAWALKHEGFTRSGQFRLESRIVLSY